MDVALNLGVRSVEGGHLVCRGAYDLPQLLEDVAFIRCTVEMCQRARHRGQGPEERPVNRNVHAVRCHVRASDAPPLIVEDSEIDTVWFHRGIWGPQAFRGCAFRRVVIRGNVTGSVAFTPSPLIPGFRAAGDATTDPYVVANRRYYDDVDWALDISEAWFTSVEFASGIPARLIRRDPETQVVLRRSTLLGRSWRVEVPDLLARIWIEDFLTSGFEDTIIVAGKRGRAFAKELELINKLRDAGLAEL
jgi:hypothetical protein